MKGLEFLHELAELAPEQLHRFALDWSLQNLHAHNAVIDWEKREPGSLAAVLNAYAQVIPWIRDNKKLTVDDLKFIHKICAAHMYSNLDAGQLRYSVVTFSILPNTSTEAGMKYFSDLYVRQYAKNQKDRYGRILLNNGEALQFLLNCGEAVQYEQIVTEDPADFFQALRRNNETFTFMGSIGDLNKREIQLLRKMAQTIQQIRRELIQSQNIVNSDFDNRKMTYIKKMALDKHPDVSPQEYEKILARLHQALHDEMTASIERLYMQLSISELVTADEKLYAIAHAVQCLERIHPFSDVNCRTFCMVFLNILLIQNDFLPALIDDPNKFDGYDCKSLVDVIKQGIERTETLQEYIKTHSRVKNTNATSTGIFSSGMHSKDHQWCHVPEEQKEILSKMAHHWTQAIQADQNQTYFSCIIS